MCGPIDIFRRFIFFSEFILVVVFVFLSLIVVICVSYLFNFGRTLFFVMCFAYCMICFIFFLMFVSLGVAVVIVVREGASKKFSFGHTKQTKTDTEHMHT